MNQEHREMLDALDKRDASLLLLHRGAYNNTHLTVVVALVSVDDDPAPEHVCWLWNSETKCFTEGVYAEDAPHAFHERTRKLGDRFLLYL